jgi:SAF domain
MLWLQSPAFGRWVAAGLLVAVAVWVEFRPDPLVDHPFAIEAIAVGEELTSLNTETRRIPLGLLDQVQPEAVATRAIENGEPILASDVRDGDLAIPAGWWVISADVPAIARAGDEVKIVLLDSGKVIEGVIASSVPDDPFAAASGGIAVAPASASEVAMAAADSRIAVLVSTG